MCTYIDTTNREKAGCWFDKYNLSQEPCIYPARSRKKRGMFACVLATRQEVQEDLQAGGTSYDMADYLAYMCRPATREEVKEFEAAGLTLKAVRQAEAGRTRGACRAANH